MSMSQIEKHQAEQRRKVPRYETFYVTVDAAIDASDLHEAGWHHENECPAGGRTVEEAPRPFTSVMAALESLHDQAHGTVPFTLCQQHPCRSLTLDQIRGAA